VGKCYALTMEFARDNPNPARFRLCRPRLKPIDLLLAALAVCLLLHSRGSMLDDPGVGWHVRGIDAMLAEGGWLVVDSFSGPQGGQPWLSNQWIGDLLLWLGWQWGGLEGIAAVTILVLLVVFRTLYGMLRADGLTPLAALVWTSLGALGTAPAWTARPNLLAVLFVLITAWTLDRYHRGRATARQTRWLLPLFAVWANAHGGFVAGLVMLGAVWTIELALSLGLPYYDTSNQEEHHSRHTARRRLRHLSILLPAAAACTLVNPYGWRLYPWVFQLLGNDYFMNLNMEWRSPDFHSRGAICYEPLMLLLPLLLAASRRRPSLVGLGLSLLWLHFALSGFRYVALWVVVTVPMLARLSRDLPGMEFFTANDSRKAARRGGWLGIAAIGLGLLCWSRYTDGFSGHNPQHIPTAALEYVLDHHDGRTVLHEYAWGGWLTWHGWPELKNWIDDRNELQGEAHVRRTVSLLRAEPGWRQQLADAGVAMVCIQPHRGLARALAEQPQWNETYRDEHAVVFELRTSNAAGRPARRPRRGRG